MWAIMAIKQQQQNESKRNVSLSINVEEKWWTRLIATLK